MDPFRLVAANVLDARLHGAEVMTRCEVTSLIMDGATVKGVKVLDKSTGQTENIYAYYVVNAAGIWGAHIAELAGVKIGMLPSKGTLLVFNHRVARVDRRLQGQCLLRAEHFRANAGLLALGDEIGLIVKPVLRKRNEQSVGRVHAISGYAANDHILLYALRGRFRVIDRVTRSTVKKSVISP